MPHHFGYTVDELKDDILYIMECIKNMEEGVSAFEKPGKKLRTTFQRVIEIHNGKFSKDTLEHMENIIKSLREKAKSQEARST